MAFRVQVSAGSSSESFRQLEGAIDQLVAPILRDSISAVKQQAVQNLSGVPFTSKTGTHTINKRSGKSAASVQTQYPYSSPYNARLFADNRTKYANNPEEWNILSILEHGRGEIKPKYTPTTKAGFTSRARLTIPNGNHQLVNGQDQFRGATGRYSFVRSIPPKEGMYWLESAIETVQPQLETIAKDHITEFLRERGF
jgi:hypothetical protein